MKREIILSGFGGQGVMSIGKNLAEAGCAEGLQVSWVPSYGPEMRGGTANCSVILSDSRIGCPLIEHPNDIVVMNRPSLARFEPLVRPGGRVLVNTSVVPDKVSRTDLHPVYVPCDDIARELGNAKVSNMVMLGAYVAAVGLVKMETVQSMIHEMFTGRKAALVPVNLQALERGAECVL